MSTSLVDLTHYHQSITRPCSFFQMPGHGLGPPYAARHRRGLWLVTTVLVLLVIGLSLDYTVSPSLSLVAEVRKSPALALC